MSALNLNPDTLAGAYELLRGTRPFYRWRLPEAEALKFRVYRSRSERGALERSGSEIVIGVSEHSNGHLYSLLETLAHEMVHLRLLEQGVKSWDSHGARFHRLAAQVCTAHGFDLKAF